MRLIDVYGNHILPEEYHYNRLLVVNENMFFVRFDDRTKETYLVDKNLKKLSKYAFSLTRRKKTPDGEDNFYIVMRKDDNKINIVTSDGRFLSPYVWFDDADGKFDYVCTPPNSKEHVRCMDIEIHGKQYYLDLEGRLYDSECKFVSDLSDGNVRAEGRKHLLNSINENLNNIFKL